MDVLVNSIKKYAGIEKLVGERNAFFIPTDLCWFSGSSVASGSGAL